MVRYSVLLVGGFKRINATLERVAVIGACAVLVVLTVVVFADVVAREVLHLTLIWASDVALFCFVWLAFLSAAIGVRYGEHFVVDVMQLASSPNAKLYRLTGYLASSVVVAVGVILLFWGVPYAEQAMRRFSYTLGLPIGYFAAIMPLSGTLMILFEAERVIKRIGVGCDDR